VKNVRCIKATNKPKYEKFKINEEVILPTTQQKVKTESKEK
jgi:hypothetical protein